MADFSELVALLQNPGDTPYEGNIYDDLSASYTEATSTRDAKIEVQGGELAAAQAEILALKAVNYDLLMASGMDNSADTVDDGNENNSEESEESDDIGDDDDFFEKKEN